MTWGRNSLACLAVTVAMLTGSTAMAQGAPMAPHKTVLGSRPSEVLLSKITVSDIVKSYDFYTKVIGLKPAMPPGIPIQPAPTKADEAAKAFIEIGFNYSGSMADAFFDIVHQRGQVPTPDTARMTWVGLKVPDVRAVLDRVRAAGYQIIREPGNASGSSVVIGMVRDPDGYNVELIQTGG